jgi:hypothetical protein
VDPVSDGAKEPINKLVALTGCCHKNELNEIEVLLRSINGTELADVLANHASLERSLRDDIKRLSDQNQILRDVLRQAMNSSQTDLQLLSYNKAKRNNANSNVD